MNGERNPINSKPNKTNGKKCQHKFWCHISFKRPLNTFAAHMISFYAMSDFVINLKRRIVFHAQYELFHIHVSFQLNTILCINFLRILSFFVYIACLRTFLSKNKSYRKVWFELKFRFSFVFKPKLSCNQWKWYSNEQIDINLHFFHHLSSHVIYEDNGF